LGTPKITTAVDWNARVPASELFEPRRPLSLPCAAPRCVDIDLRGNWCRLSRLWRWPGLAPRRRARRLADDTEEISFDRAKLTVDHAGDKSPKIVEQIAFALQPSLGQFFAFFRHSLAFPLLHAT
jgi:hypothetical protein